MKFRKVAWKKNTYICEFTGKFQKERKMRGGKFELYCKNVTIRTTLLLSSLKIYVYRGLQ